MVGYPPDDVCARFPLIEQATVGAVGLVVHAESQVERLLNWWVGPFARLHLPSYDAEVVFEPAPEPIPVEGRRLRLVTIGWIGRAKQVHQVIEALGRRPGLAEKFEYRIAGAFDPGSEYGRELLQLVDQHQLQDTVEFLGYVDDDRLSSEIAVADVFANLRWPSTEGGSAALVQQLITGRPVIVSRTGVFGELPDDAVVKVAANDPDSVADALEQMAGDSELRRRIGSAGHATARQFTVEAYARGLARLLETSIGWQPVLSAVDRIGDRLGEIGARADMPFLDSVGAELSQLFGPRFSQGRSMQLSPAKDEGSAS
jgi:glycosyltransferase involved in cell wall biosynthesis